MKKINKELECLIRYIELSSLEDVLSKLINLEIISTHDANGIALSSSPQKEIHRAISIAKDKGTIQLLEYEWQLLPKEIIKITIVTDKSNADLSAAIF